MQWDNNATPQSACTPVSKQSGDMAGKGDGAMGIFQLGKQKQTLLSMGRAQQGAQGTPGATEGICGL